jgi:hypothetical protein
MDVLEKIGKPQFELSRHLPAHPQESAQTEVTHRLIRPSHSGSKAVAPSTPGFSP